MRILQINAVPYGSTGRIMFSLADIAGNVGYETMCAVGFTWQKSDRRDCITVSNFCEKSFHLGISRLTGRDGHYSYLATKRLIKKAELFSPDIIHIHNLHGWYLNLPMLFSYLKKKRLPVVWTLHDCWSFTGHCPHFDKTGCDKWKNGCGDCRQYRSYPGSLFDNSDFMYRRKKQWFTGVPKLTVVTPSVWLAGLVKQSFLSDYPVRVINNGIDLSVFKPVESSFREKHGCNSCNVILGVSFGWNENKGIDVFLELAKRLDKSFKIVLVGTDEKDDALVPDNIISIHRTKDKRELAEIYTAADVFVNPTREDTYPTVNMEALACGTPVITFDTGGSPEILNGSCGAVVPKNDIDALEHEIIRLCTDRPIKCEMCLRRAAEFNMNDRFGEYLDLYEELTDEQSAKD